MDSPWRKNNYRSIKKKIQIRNNVRIIREENIEAATTKLVLTLSIFKDYNFIGKSQESQLKMGRRVLSPRYTELAEPDINL